MIMTIANTGSQLVRLLYLEMPELSACSAKITQIGSGTFGKNTYQWIKLDKTIFHPQGGGQLSDMGTINGLPVVYVHKEKINGVQEIEVLHCFDQPISFHQNQDVNLEVDMKNRYKNSVWHTGAHVLDYLVTKYFPNLKGDSGQCYPDNAFMKFTTNDGKYPTKETLKKAVEEGFKAALSSFNLNVVENEGVRCISINNHDIPCGGTHIHDVEKEMGTLIVKNVTWEKKEQKLRVSYILENANENPSKVHEGK